MAQWAYVLFVAFMIQITIMGYSSIAASLAVFYQKIGLISKDLPIKFEAFDFSYYNEIINWAGVLGVIAVVGFIIYIWVKYYRRDSF